MNPKYYDLADPEGGIIHTDASVDIIQTEWRRVWDDHNGVEGYDYMLVEALKEKGFFAELINIQQRIIL